MWVTVDISVHQSLTNIVIRAQRGLVGIMFVQRRRQWPSITSAVCQCIVLFGASGAGIESVTRIVIHMQPSENKAQSPMLFQCRALIQQWAVTLGRPTSYVRGTS